MSRTTTGASLAAFAMAAAFVLAAAAALAASTIASAAPAAAVVKGTVGLGFTITLTLGGKKVTKLKAGRYRFIVNDRATIHDFHLSGPGLNRVLTTVEFTGTRSVLLTLRKGAYHYFCDPHASFMKGAFKAT
jgi:plastocyanin